MKKKIVSYLLLVAMTASILTGCGSNSGTQSTEQESKPQTADQESKGEAKKNTAISFYTTETGKDQMFQDVIAQFEIDNPGITVEYIAAGDDQLQKWMSLYASNEGPTVSFMDPINIFENQERMKNFSKEECPWLDNVEESALGTFTYDGKVYGIPGSAAGFGLLYNQRVCDEAVGGTFDPATIKTRKDLKDLFDKIEEKGVAASMLTGVNWSLGSHYLGLVYGAYRGDVAAREAFVKSQKEGTAGLADDKVFNSLMETFDLIADHNYNKADPLVGNVNMDAEAFATGKAATWFMGDWAWTYIAELENRDTEFGILPIPVSDDANDPLNRIIPTSYAKGYCVDASQNTEEQQQAGMKFIEYLVTSKYAQDTFVKVCGQAFPYKGITAEIESPLGRATSEYISSGQIFDFYGTANMLPSDFWYENGASMCEYLSGACERNTLAGKIDSYWKNIQ